MSPSPAGLTGPAPGLARLAVVVFALSTVVERFLAIGLSEHHWDSDFAQHVWWTARFADPTLFPNDPIADFFSLPLFSPLGYQAWMRGAVPLLGAQAAAEALILPLAAVLVWLGWRAGRSASAGSWIGAVIGGLAAGWLIRFIDGGLPRDFALPLLCLGMVGLLERRLRVLGLAAVLAALFYPPVVVNLGLTAGVALGVDALRARRLPAGWPGLAVAAAVAIAILASVYLAPVPEDIGPKVTGSEARTLAEFGPDGRTKFFTDSAIETYFGKGRGGYGISPLLSSLFAAVVAISARTLPRLLPLAAWALLGTALLTHALAHATLFLLHLPQRYMLYALPTFALLFFASLGSRALPRLLERTPALASRRNLALLATLMLAVDAGLSLRTGIDDLQKPLNLDRIHTFDYLATLPVDTRVAAHPKDGNAIPLRAHRSVLVSKETSLPYYRGYYEPVAERYEAALRGFYASDWATLDQLFERFGADVMVVNKYRYREDQRRAVPPFDARVPERLAARKEFVLLRPPEERLLFRAGSFSVVRLGPPRPGYEVRAEGSALTEKSPAAAGTR